MPELSQSSKPALLSTKTRSTNPKSERYIAIDLGAESGRGILARFDGARITLEEIGRFATSRGKADLDDSGVMRWDIERIKLEIDAVLRLARSGSKPVAGVGIDSWGVDVGFFDSSGRLLASPVCYRDDSHAAARSSLFARVDKDTVWDETGIQSMPFNTLYQLEAIKQRDPGLLDKASSMLHIPDVVHSLLSGAVVDTSEVTLSSTSQMMLPGASDWNRLMLERLSIPTHFLKPVAASARLVGNTVDGKIPIYAPATHDTASAVAAIAASNADNKPDETWAFLSSGTWSLIGVELPSPIVTREAQSAGFSNEAGICDTTRFLKNIMGLWLLQRSRHSLSQAGHDYSYIELTSLAADSPAGALIDATDERLLNPPDMIASIRELCSESGQIAPQTPGEIARCCIESLALAYRLALRHIERLIGKRVTRLHIVGGGTQNTLLNQWTADACGIEVVAGPVEGAAIGNILAQLIGSGRVSTWEDARAISRESFLPQSFMPEPNKTEWTEREAKIVPLWRQYR